MGSIGDMLRGANLSSEFKESDEDVIATVTKLTNIVKMFNDFYPEVALEIHASPLDIIQTKVHDIDRLSIYVGYNKEKKSQVADAMDMLKSLVNDEFETKNGVSVEFETEPKWKEPTILLYTLFPAETLESELRSTLYWDLYSLVFFQGITASVPIGLGYRDNLGILLHCNGIDDISRLHKMLPVGNQQKLVEFSQRDKWSKEVLKDSPIYYVPMLRQEPIRYELPYLYITRESFDEKYLEEVLKTLST